MNKVMSFKTPKTVQIFARVCAKFLRAAYRIPTVIRVGFHKPPNKPQSLSFIQPNPFFVTLILEATFFSSAFICGNRSHNLRGFKEESISHSKLEPSYATANHSRPLLVKFSYHLPLTRPFLQCPYKKLRHITLPLVN